MRRKKFILFFAILSIICSFFSLQESFAQQDPNDPGKPDSVYFGTIDYYRWSDSLTGKLRVPIIFANDEHLTGLLVPLAWTEDLSLDSISFAGTRVDWITKIRQVKIDNENQRMWIKVIVAIPPAVIYGGTGPLSFLYFDIADTGWVVLDTLSFDDVELAFGGIDAILFVPQFQKGVFYLTSTDPSAGDVNLDRKVDIADAIFLANYILKGGLTPLYPASADPDKNCKINLADVIYLCNYIFKGTPAPQMGCISY